MFYGVIGSILENLIVFSAKTFWEKVSLVLKSKKIENELVTRFNDLILTNKDDIDYYYTLNSFLTTENFVKKIMDYCFYPPTSLIESTDSYIKYLVEKFVNNNPTYFSKKDLMFNHLHVVSNIIFETINDYSNDENARLVIKNVTETVNRESNKISQQNEKIIKMLEDRTFNKDRESAINFNDQDAFILYKNSLKNRYNRQNQYLPRNIYSEKDTKRSSMDSLLKDKQLVLLGEPGCGKTFESINLLKEICTNTVFEEYIPVYMELAQYGIVYSSIVDGIRKQLFPFYGLIIDEELVSEFKRDRFIIILDGIDEIRKDENRLRFFSDINQLLSYSNVYFFITSRINPYHGNIKKVVEYRINDLTQQQIWEVVQNSGIGFSTVSQYFELFKNPLFLHVGINVLKNCTGKFYNKSQLFNSYFEEVLYKRDLSKQLPEANIKNYHNILMIIGKLAYETFDKNQISISEFDEIFKVNSKGYTSINICDVFRIDIFKIENTISFTHKQFKEYFAAYYLVKNFDMHKNRDLFISLMKKEQWQEVMVFAAGLITDISEQNKFLDMMIEINLKTYISCVKYKIDLSDNYERLSHEEYSIKYLEMIHKSYTLIIETYFPNIHEKFEPFLSNMKVKNKDKKIGLCGKLSEDRKSLFFWFDWKENNENPIQLISETDIIDPYKDLAEQLTIVTHSVNLERSEFLGDSARQMSINLIYTNIEKIIKKYNLVESDYILYEKLCYQIKRIEILKDKSLVEIANWAIKCVEEVNEELDTPRREIVSCSYNGADIIKLMNIANYLVDRNGTHETLSLPKHDLQSEPGWEWKLYSKGRVNARLKKFFLWRQRSFCEMVESNFPKMKDYFLLIKDSPYRYRIHLRFNDREDYLSDPIIKYYRMSIESSEPDLPEIIITEQFSEDSEEIFKLISQSFHNNGKECKNSTVTTTGFSKTLMSNTNSGNTPLTEVVYQDLEKAFKELFE